METEKARGTEWGRGTKRSLVLGGTGKTGRRVVRRLVARGFSTRVGSRSGEPPFEWEDEATWAPALRDVESVYISYYPDLAVPGAVAAARSFVDLAVEAGVGRLALLSGRGEEEAQRTELAVQETVGEVARAAGREIRYVPVSVQEYSSMLVEHDVPAEFVSLLTYLFSEVLDGRNAHLTDGVRRALGREPRDFADYARDAAATGVWGGG
jgi:uncharacterized protein YbjT (DUF2867 family)